jgi:hypothetical protein
VRFDAPQAESREQVVAKVIGDIAIAHGRDAIQYANGERPAMLVGPRWRRLQREARARSRAERRERIAERRRTVSVWLDASGCWLMFDPLKQRGDSYAFALDGEFAEDEEGDVLPEDAPRYDAACDEAVAFIDRLAPALYPRQVLRPQLRQPRRFGRGRVPRGIRRIRRRVGRAPPRADDDPPLDQARPDRARPIGVAGPHLLEHRALRRVDDFSQAAREAASARGKETAWSGSKAS